jgi:hypothetical protein
MPAKSIYDNGNLVDGTMVGGKRVEPELTEEEELLEPIYALVRKVIKEKEKTHQKLEKKLRDVVNRRYPTGSSITARRQAIFWKNKRDLAVENTDKGNEDLAVMVARAIVNTGKIGALAHEVATASTEYMYSQDDELRDDVQLYGRALSEVLSEIIATAAVEGTTMYPEIVFKEIGKLYRE